MKLRPSSAARWMQCPGSVAMCERYPGEDSEASREGTAAHAAAVEYLTHGTIPEDDEMRAGAELFAEAIGPERSSLMLETFTTIPYVHPENGGTPDAWRLFGNIIDVWDYKFGFGVVEVFENWQLLDYAVGIVGNLQLPPDSPVRIRLTVVQPRVSHRDGPVRTWELSMRELIEYADLLKAGAHAAMEPDAPCDTGDECKYCSARHACPALQAAGYASVEMSRASIPVELSPDALGRELAMLSDAAKRLDARISGLSQQVESIVRDGARVPGWHLEQGYGREIWDKPLDEVFALGTMMSIDLAKPGAITPKQAIKAGIPAEVVRAYSVTPPGDVKLVRDDGRLSRVFRS